MSDGGLREVSRRPQGCPQESSLKASAVEPDFELRSRFPAAVGSPPTVTEMTSLSRLTWGLPQASVRPPSGLP